MKIEYLVHDSCGNILQDNFDDEQSAIWYAKNNDAARNAIARYAKRCDKSKRKFLKNITLWTLSGGDFRGSDEHIEMLNAIKQENQAHESDEY